MNFLTVQISTPHGCHVTLASKLRRKLSMSRIELSKVASVSVHSEDVSRIAEPQFAKHRMSWVCSICLYNYIVFRWILIFHNDRAPQRVGLLYGLRTHGVTSTNTLRRSCLQCCNMPKVASQKTCVTPMHSQNREPWNLFLACHWDQNCDEQ